MKVYICPDTLAELKDLETTLTGISDHQLEGASSILIRVDGPLWINLVQGGFTDPADIKHAANSALRRVPSKTLYLAPSLTWLATQPQSAILVNQFLPRCFEFSVDPPHVANISSNEALDKLRRGCLNVEVSKGLSRCTVTPPVTHHFSLPSGAHASHFIRLSELFSSMQSVDSIAYWIGTSLIEDVEGAARPPRLALLVDHASMLMLGTRVQRLLNTDAPVECLPGYPVDLESRAHVRATIELLAGTSLPLHSLIGVASTGKLKKTLNELALQADIGLTVTVLFSTSNIDGVDAIAALSVPGYQHFVSKTVCELCASGNSHPIKIQANSLLITIEKPKPISLPPQCFEPQKDFISTWGAQLGVLRVHFDDPNEATPRHHAYGIDASALLANQEFKNLVIADLKQLAPAPNLAVVPGHLSAALLSSIVKDALGIEVISDLDLKAGNSVLQRTYKNPVVLVFDDKTVSGQRLKSINDGLRRVGVAAWGTFKHVHFFCPVATPESKDAFEKLERGLTTNHD